jgi:hypothetical protein
MLCERTCADAYTLESTHVFAAEYCAVLRKAYHTDRPTVYTDAALLCYVHATLLTGAVRRIRLA